MDAVRHPTITPLNSLLYNSKSSNLAQHGTHPRYQHFVANIPQLLGPALPLLLWNLYQNSRTASLPPQEVLAGLAGTMILSIFPHQEARFLLPVVPILLMSVRLPLNRKVFRIFISVWIVFNLILGLLMGVYHQAGVYPAQMWLESQSLEMLPNDTSVFWWKTYSPPTWLLNGRNSDVRTIDLMGLPIEQLQNKICRDTPAHSRFLVAPTSVTLLDQFQSGNGGLENGKNELVLSEEVWSTRTHLNLDDLDFGDDDVMPTLRRVIVRRGLAIWSVECSKFDVRLGRRVPI